MEQVGLAALNPDELMRKCHEIGETPLVPVELKIDSESRLFLKLEGFNPGGSLKDRPALSIITCLEGAGRLDVGDLLVDSTSGNFGVSMAWICRARGYRFLAITDPRATAGNSTRMAALGAMIEVVSERDITGGYLLTRLARAAELARSPEVKAWTNQYLNPANPRSHYSGTAREIFQNPIVSTVDAVFVPASTGGTLAGIGQFAREHYPEARVIAVDGEGSSLFGGKGGPRVINGLGSSHASAFLNSSLYDEVVKVTARTAISYCQALRDVLCISVGGSSGASVAAAVSWLSRQQKTVSVVCVCPDGGENYAESIFKEGWVEQVGGRVKAIGIE